MAAGALLLLALAPGGATGSSGPGAWWPVSLNGPEAWQPVFLNGPEASLAVPAAGHETPLQALITGQGAPLPVSLNWPVVSLPVPAAGHEAPRQAPFTGYGGALPVSFDGRHGQIEVGGPYAGAEFHYSRPLPARISFYYPVANSIDLSRDYWRRGESRPLRLTLRRGNAVDSLGRGPCPYRYTPFFAEFTETLTGVQARYSYRFCRDLPVMVLELALTNTSQEAQEFILESELECLLRTCQTYAEMRPAVITNRPAEGFDGKDAGVATALYTAPETGPAALFLVNAGAPVERTGSGGEKIALRYLRTLQPGEEWRIIQLIGTCRPPEIGAMTARAAKEWQGEAARYEEECLDYAGARFHLELPDSGLMQTARWSRAVLGANRHYLDGRIVPMPCPAEYNFFFTHDLLLTDLGAVFFDIRRVKEDLLYLLTLTRPDSILPHAYYWRDSGFQTEYCSSDNWNHLWFVMLAGAYWRHSGDSATLRRLAPLLHKSLQMMLENKGSDDLMYAGQPDWWDIGDTRGARSYITILMVRALREFAAMSEPLGVPASRAADCLELSRRMQLRLQERLWDEKAAFLLNGLEGGGIDHHLYAGSLLAAAWEVIEPPLAARLLQTAAEQLLDRRLGVRIAVPMDFEDHIDTYHFLPGEVGAPGLYLNGGIWPHGIVWYALGWLAAAEADSAREVLQRYLTLDGISRSPNGQPAFFEYRNANPASPRYGEIDKPTFLWAGGWFLHALYQLAGMRDNAWNLSFAPLLPSGWERVAYDAMIAGKSARVTITGQGDFFHELRCDGRRIHSAVMTRPCQELTLVRGLPAEPYLAAADCRIDRVRLERRTRRLEIDLRGNSGQKFELQVVSPWPPLAAEGGRTEMQRTGSEGAWKVSIKGELVRRGETVVLRFGQ